MDQNYAACPACGRRSVGKEFGQSSAPTIFGRRGSGPKHWRFLVTPLGEQSMWMCLNQIRGQRQKVGANNHVNNLGLVQSRNLKPSAFSTTTITGKPYTSSPSSTSLAHGNRSVTVPSSPGDRKAADVYELHYGPPKPRQKTARGTRRTFALTCTCIDSVIASTTDAYAEYVQARFGPGFKFPGSCRQQAPLYFIDVVPTSSRRHTFSSSNLLDVKVAVGAQSSACPWEVVKRSE